MNLSSRSCLHQFDKPAYVIEIVFLCEQSCPVGDDTFINFGESFGNPEIGGVVFLIIIKRALGERPDALYVPRVEKFMAHESQEIFVLLLIRKLPALSLDGT